MDTLPVTEQRPDQWKVVPPGLYETVRERTLAALEPQSAAVHLAWYYDRDGNFAGSTFSELGPVVRDDITVADLLATQLLFVRIGPRSTRRLLEHGTHRTDVLAALRDEALNVELQVAGPETLEAMGRLHGAVKLALSTPSAKRSSPWVTAAKLCARKRPDLFPVRDNLVQKYLGLRRLSSYEIEYQLYRRLIGDTEIVKALDQAKAQAALIEPGRVRDLVITDPILRVLDVVLWTHAKYGISKPSEVAPVPDVKVEQVG